MKRYGLIHYHEISLKQNNRGWFENCLKRHVEALLHDLPCAGIQRSGGRMIVELELDSPVQEIERRLKTAFGIANFAIAWRLEADLGTIRETLPELLTGRVFHSFKIDARRGTKDFPLNSQQINTDIGAFVQQLTGAKVDLENPDLTCFLEFVGPHVYVYFEKIRGGGGLPFGSGGRVLCLISGGIDSPVAAFKMMRRGCKVSFVHFHSLPHTTRESQDKVRRLLQILSRYQISSRLHMVPFADLQREIVAYAPPPLRVLLYRRFMLRIAENLARRDRASALVTGDSIGQVASQTLQNICVVSEVTRMPVFRPLIGDDKEDIIHAARQIGTYEISILPDQDCCTLFVPRHPETMARQEQIADAEQHLDVERLVTASFEGTEHETIASDYSPVHPSYA